MKLRILYGCSALALAAAAVSAAPALPAAAAVSQPAAPAQPMSSGSGPGQNLSATVSSSWQTNGTVWAIASANGVVYVGGDFTSVRPPGDPAGTGEVARSYLAAFNASTGALLSFDPTLDGQVTALAVSPDGGTLYVGGSFTHANGASHSYLAAYATSTGNILTSWKPSATGSVLTLTTSPDGSALYVGGNFGKLDTVVHNRIGAISAATGSLLPWNPIVNGSVTSIAVAPDDSQVVIGGYFTSFNGVAQNSIGATDPAAGTASYNIPALEPLGSIDGNSCTANVKDIVISTADSPTASGTAYIASEGTGGGCFDGDYAVNLSSGSGGVNDTLAWQNDCLGATQSLVVVNNLLYKGSHAHDCDFSPGGFPQVNNPSGGWITHRLLTQSLADGSIGHWNPNTNGNNLGPRVMATDGTNLFLGGDFSTVNNLPQQGFAIFRPGPDNAPATPAAPTVVSTSQGVDSVTFTGVSDPDDGTLTYSIYRNGLTSPVGTITATSWPWALPVLHFRDAGLAVGGVHSYQVTASDGTLTSAKSASSAKVTVSGTNPPLSYQATVLADSPTFLWPLDETSGSTASDASPNGFNGIYEPGTTQGVPGPITGSSESATGFDGHTGLVTSASSVPGPQRFSIELWFKTTANTGGKLIGFGSNQTGASSSYDRHIYMMNDGQLVFGIWNGQTETIETPRAYNDGQWHYAVATYDSSVGSNNMALYIDGQLTGTATSSSAQAYSGYWRVGGDNLNGWNLDPWGCSLVGGNMTSCANSVGTTEPVSYYFSGDIGDVAVYPTALTAAQVAAHYAANALSH